MINDTIQTSRSLLVLQGLYYDTPEAASINARSIAIAPKFGLNIYSFDRRSKSLCNPP
ncbi:MULTISPECIES: hypothetical protein [unclassified Microcoleus]|uniref:hypothetical protein n=1 Tax=unclassified Microcoleus TaxID=2642155 RepID=UPI0025D1F234|nr:MULTISPECIES: hypothetical protein [unclassified Microcoleus]